MQHVKARYVDDTIFQSIVMVGEMSYLRTDFAQYWSRWRRSGQWSLAAGEDGTDIIFIPSKNSAGIIKVS